MEWEAQTGKCQCSISTFERSCGCTAFDMPTQWSSCVCVVHFCVAVYLLVLYMCAQIRVWSCLFTDNFGLFTEIAACKFLRDLAVVWPVSFFYCVHCCPLWVFIHFSASFCTTHCALDLARDYAPYKCPLYYYYYYPGQSVFYNRRALITSIYVRGGIIPLADEN